MLKLLWVVTSTGFLWWAAAAGASAAETVRPAPVSHLEHQMPSDLSAAINALVAAEQAHQQQAPAPNPFMRPRPRPQRG